MEQDRYGLVSRLKGAEGLDAEEVRDRVVREAAGPERRAAVLRWPRRYRARVRPARRSTSSPASTRGSSTTSGRSSSSRRSSAPSGNAEADRGSPPEVLREAKEWGFSDIRLGRAAGGAEEAEVRALARGGRHPAGLQAGGHLRRGVRGPHPLPLLHLRVRVRGASPTDRRKVIILGGGPNRIGQGIEFDYCCVHAVFALEEDGLRDHHGQLQPGDRLHRLRHLRPALLRAAHPGGRAEHRRDGEAQGGDRPVRRADPAQAGQGPGGRGRAHHRHQPRLHRPGRGPGAVPEAAARARAPAARQRHRAQPRGGRGGGADRSATRWWCAPPTCWAAGPWRSSTTRRALQTLHERGGARPAPSTRCSSTSSWTTPSRWTWTRSATGAAS